MLFYATKKQKNNDIQTLYNGALIIGTVEGSGCSYRAFHRGNYVGWFQSGYYARIRVLLEEHGFERGNISIGIEYLKEEKII